MNENDEEVASKEKAAEEAALADAERQRRLDLEDLDAERDVKFDLKNVGGLKFAKSDADLKAETAFDDHYSVEDPRAKQD